MVLALTCSAGAGSEFALHLAFDADVNASFFRRRQDLPTTLLKLLERDVCPRPSSSASVADALADERDTGGLDFQWMRTDTWSLTIRASLLALLLAGRGLYGLMLV